MLLTAALTELLVAKDYTPRSALRREDVLRKFITWCAANAITDTKDVDKALGRRYLAHLRTRPNLRSGGKLAGETQHSSASIVRMFLRWLADDGEADEKVVTRVDMPRIPHKVVEVFSPAQYQRLVVAADTQSMERVKFRDKALSPCCSTPAFGPKNCVT
jgi:site-specific recombinase XerD